ncbi:MAG: hypothetical protein HJJLKODD_02511 [Phycisphaerae bacterium]|nr:hypothetical protein [Phycisphaerae bacterium]
MISCEQTRNLLDGYLNDDLSASMTAELDAHLLDCPACRHQLSLMEACGNVVRLDMNEPAVSADFTDRLMAILENQPTERASGLQLSRRMKLAVGLVGVAAAAALTFVAIMPGSNETNNTPLIAGRQVEGTSGPGLNDQFLQEFTGLSFPILFDAVDHLNSAWELGQLPLGPALVPPTSYEAQSIPPVQPDITESLPDLEDGAELM